MADDFTPLVKSFLSSCYMTVPYDIVEPYIQFAESQLPALECDDPDDDTKQLFALLFVIDSASTDCVSKAVSLLLSKCPSLEKYLIL